MPLLTHPLFYGNNLIHYITQATKGQEENILLFAVQRVGEISV